MSAYALAQAAQQRGHKLSFSQAARLARDEWYFLSRDTIDALSEVLGVPPGDLFVPGNPAALPKRGRGRPKKEAAA